LAFRQHGDFWIVTGVAIGMLWRGEAWKSACLEAEQSLSELRQPLRLPSESSAGFYDPDQMLAYGDVRYVQSRASLPFLAVEFVESRRCVASSAQTQQEDSGPYKEHHKPSASQQRLDSEGYLARLNVEPSLGLRALHLSSQADYSRSYQATQERGATPNATAMPRPMKRLREPF
jgi:hypothetical protein